MDKLISVIVPIYKVEDYLEQCIDSIVNQTYKNLEIILVDDGSPDRCPQICDEYAQKDNRIIVIHKENGGLSSARNAGLDIASGDYVEFVDSDDYLVDTMCQDLLKAAESQMADVVVCDVYVSKREKLETYSLNSNKITTIQNIENVFLHFIKPQPYIRFEVWNKLFKKEVIDNIRFVEGQIYEDLYFDREVFSKQLNVVHIEKALYVYRENRPGSTNSYFRENRFTYFQEMDKYFDIFGKWNNDMLIKVYADSILDTCTSFYFHAKKLQATDTQKRKIIVKFHFYYSKFSPILDMVRPKYIIFNLSPDLYFLVSEGLNFFRKA